MKRKRTNTHAKFKLNIKSIFQIPGTSFVIKRMPTHAMHPMKSSAKQWNTNETTCNKPIIRLAYSGLNLRVCFQPRLLRSASKTTPLICASSSYICEFFHEYDKKASVKDPSLFCTKYNYWSLNTSGFFIAQLLHSLFYMQIQQCLRYIFDMQGSVTTIYWGVCFLAYLTFAFLAKCLTNIFGSYRQHEILQTTNSIQICMH